MQRRDLLRAAGGIGAAGAVGVGGTFFLTGGAAADGDAFLTADGDSITTSDGEIEYVSFGGTVQFEWDHLDTDATHGEIVTKSTVQGAEGFNEHGTIRGQLGDEGSVDGHDGNGQFEDGEGNSPNSWGGSNDTNSGVGKEGSFTFRFGSKHGQRDYAIAYDDDDFEHGNPIASPNAWSTDYFEAGADGGDNTTTVTIQKICRVYDGDPGGDGEVLVEDMGEASFDIVVNNKEGEGNTSGHLEGNAAGDEV